MSQVRAVASFEPTTASSERKSLTKSVASSHSFLLSSSEYVPAAMRETGRCALAKWAARGKMYLVLIRPVEKGLVMQVLHYADEVRSFDEVPVGDTAVKDSELKLAVQLIDQISVEEFNPAAYEDEVKKRYQEAIQKKVEGQEITAAAPEAPKGQIIDLMEALKASLAKSKTAAEEEKAAAKRAKAEPKARKRA